MVQTAAEVAPGAGFTLAHNVDSREAVRKVLEQAQRAGATANKLVQDAAFGGYHGYFADAAGIRWEIAHNPGWRVDADGRVSIGVIE